VRKADARGDVDETLLERDLLEAAPEREEPMSMPSSARRTP